MKTRTGGAVPIMNQYDTCQLVQKWFLVCCDCILYGFILKCLIHVCVMDPKLYIVMKGFWGTLTLSPSTNEFVL